MDAFKQIALAYWDAYWPWAAVFAAGFVIGVLL